MSFRDLVRPAVRLARKLVSRSLHPYHRRRSIEALRDKRVHEVIVLCHGNVCRSPYAEAVLRRELASLGIADVHVHSAGFVGPDRPSPADALVVAAERGIDMTAHRSKLITGQALQAADLVVVMSPEQAVDVTWRGAGARSTVLVLGDLDPDQIDSRTIRDPWNCDQAVFWSSYRRIDRCVKELARNLVKADPSRSLP